MIRLFVGLELPAEVRERLRLLLSGIPYARWTPAENLHLTLRFIGEVDEVQAEAAHDALLGVDAAGFELTIRGCGAFDGGHRAQTLWAGVDRCDGLAHLHDKVEAAVVRAGLAPERRKFSPHITLARVKAAPLGRVQDYIAGNNLLRLSFPVERFVLFSSRLGRNDPLYRIEADYPLRGGV